MAVKPLLGIFGGTFDPVHRGHTGAIEALSEVVNFDRIHWVLSARPPHKQTTSAAVEHRFAMLQLALRQRADFFADASEINRDQISWTIDTVKEFRQQFPGHEVVMIIGGDSFNKLPTWHRHHELIEQVHFLVMARPGYKLATAPELKDKILPALDQFPSTSGSSIGLFEASDFAISSTDIRQQLFANKVSDLLDSEVAAYIRKHRLYQKV